jgi:hypothetical protein
MPAFDSLIVDFCNSQKGKDLFQTILEHIEKYYKDEYETLKKIAFNPQKNSIIGKEDGRSIDHLVKYGLIDYDKTSDFISFRIHALQNYIKETEEKRPEDMDNDERRRYVQDKIVICERKIKEFIRDYYIRTGDEDRGRNMLAGRIQPNKQYMPLLDPLKCRFEELFDHKKFIMFFSELKKIINSNWAYLGRAFENKGMDRSQFNASMNDLNAGRTDADHYDPEDGIYPNDWIISDTVLRSFMVAYERFDNIFRSLHL